MIELKDIQIKFQNTVLENGYLNIYTEQITVITGPSGCGKTSLLNILGLLDQNNEYEYIFQGNHIEKNNIEEIKRTRISYVFQDYNAIAEESIKDNFHVMFEIAGIPYSEHQMKQLLQQVSLEHLNLNKKCKTLSGGEKQRLAIALAMVKQPELLLLDEPTAHLDEKNTNTIVEILQNLKETGLMIVVASHHPNVYHADHIYQIKDQKIIETLSCDKHTDKQLHTDKRSSFSVFRYATRYLFNHIWI